MPSSPSSALLRTLALLCAASLAVSARPVSARPQVPRHGKPSEEHAAFRGFGGFPSPDLPPHALDPEGSANVAGCSPSPDGRLFFYVQAGRHPSLAASDPQGFVDDLLAAGLRVRVLRHEALPTVAGAPDFRARGVWSDDALVLPYGLDATSRAALAGPPFHAQTLPPLEQRALYSFHWPQAAGMPGKPSPYASDEHGNPLAPIDWPPRYETYDLHVLVASTWRLLPYAPPLSFTDYGTNPVRMLAWKVDEASGHFELDANDELQALGVGDATHVARIDVRVVVRDPRTPSAAIERTEVLNQGPQFLVGNVGPFQLGLQGSEPSHARGHVVYTLINTFNDEPFPLPQGPPTSTGSHEPPIANEHIYYSYNAEPFALTGWSIPKPLNRLVEDRDVLLGSPELPLRLGDVVRLAEQPLREADGTPFPAEYPFDGNYPWSGDGEFLVFNARGFTALALAGTATNYTVQHLDAWANRSRDHIRHRVFSGTGSATPGEWPWTKISEDPLVPYTRHPHVLPLVGGWMLNYVEAALYDANDYALVLPMNEYLFFDRYKVGGPDWSLDVTRTGDASGNLNSAHLTGGARFRQEYLAAIGACTDPWGDCDSTLPLPSGVRGGSRGFVGQAVYFPDEPGERGVVHVADGPAFDALTGDLTVQLFVDLEETAPGFDGFRPLVLRPASFGLAAHASGALVGIVSSGSDWRAVVSPVDVVRSLPWRAGDPAEAGWHHVAMTFVAAADGAASGTLTLFVDGVPVASVETPFASIADTDQPLLIGPGSLDLPPVNRWLAIDELRVSGNVGHDLLASAYARPAGAAWMKEPRLPALPAHLEAAAAQVPADNPLTQSKVDLGRALFGDEALSANQQVSCASCHRPDTAFADAGAALSLGVGGTPERNTPAVFDRLFSTHQGMDGHAPSLEEQVLLPIQSPLEMDQELADVLAYLNGAGTSRYAPLFERAYGTERATAARVAGGLASYLRAIVSNPSRVDLYEAGQTGRLLPDEVAGRALFHGKARCSVCHFGSTYSDEHLDAYHVTVVDGDDPGRRAVTGLPGDHARFKTPTLRNLGFTAPYFHDGSKATLAEVIEAYDVGGERMDGLVDDAIVPLGLTPLEKAQLAAFLRALDGIDATGATAPTSELRGL